MLVQHNTTGQVMYWNVNLRTTKRITGRMRTGQIGDRCEWNTQGRGVGIKERKKAGLE